MRRKKSSLKIVGFSIFLLISFFIFVLLNGYFIFLYTPFNQQLASIQKKITFFPSSNQIFENKYHNYSIEIPFAWKAEIISEDLEEASWTYIHSDDDKYSFLISAENFDPLLSFEENSDYWFKYYFSSTSAGLLELNARIENTEDVFIDNRRGIKYLYSYDIYQDSEKARGAGFEIHFLINKKNDQFINDQFLLKIKAEAENDEILNTYNQIISTFKFMQ